MATVLAVINNARFSLLPSTFIELTEGLRQLGHAAELASFPDPNDGREEFERGYDAICARIQAMLDRGEDFFVLDSNCKLAYSSVRRTAPLRRFSYVTDAPWSQFEHIRTVGDDTTISYVDRNHRAFHDRFFPGRKAVFLPHGGPLPDGAFRIRHPVPDRAAAPRLPPSP